MEFKDYYTIMGLKREATQDEIKRSYRKLARKYHPDVSKETDAEDKFKELGEAYEVLKDPEKRAAYDQLGANWKSGQDFKPPPDWDAGFEFKGGGFTGGDASAFSDFFESLYGREFSGTQSRQTAFHAQGEDHHAKVLINLEDAFHGVTRTISLRMPELDAQGHIQTRERNLSIKIPKGIRQGQQIRLAAQGGPGMGEGDAGDLYLKVEFRTHPLYRVEGKDLYLDLPIAPWEAALGAAVKVPTPSGVVDLKIPAGSVSGGKLRLKGRGIPAQSAGDLYVLLQIVLPPADNEQAKALYHEMEQKLTFDPRAKMGV